MTPNRHKTFLKEEKERIKKLSEEWIFPLAGHRKKMGTILRDMESFKLNQEDIPLIIKLVENPRYKTSRLFTGAIDLFSHDCMHIILGRGLLLKDEAFVIGYTMGSSKKMKWWRRNLFMFVSKYFYPSGYDFGEEERFIFNQGVKAGSFCKTDLSKVNFKELAAITTHRSRKRLGIEKSLLTKCYELEKSLFPNSKESQRLL
jgi:hypothetical protein